MSSAEKAAGLLTAVDPRELRVLQAIELGMAKHEFVPRDLVVRYSGLVEEEVDYWLKELDRKDLLWRQIESYIGFILNYSGYDILALNALVKAEVIDALGVLLGTGKEADVFEARAVNGSDVAIKLHRLGRVSFRNTRRKREFIADRRHISWLYQSRLAAEKEYEALKRAYNVGVSVPRPFHQNRHTVVMQLIRGHRLNEVAALDDPISFFDEIVDNIKKAYVTGLIHADLSEYNIQVTDEGEVFLFDWPQWIESSHPNSIDILERDVRNVANYFEKKYRLKIDLKEVLLKIKS